MNEVIEVGWVQIYLFSLIILFAFLWFGFVFFKKAREYYIEEEVSLDSILLMGLLGVVMARLVFMITNMNIFGDSWIRVLFLKEYPGMSGWGAVLGLVLAVALVVRKTKQKLFDWLDLVSLALASALPIVEAGKLIMKQGGLLWGVIPEMMVSTVLLLMLFWGLWKVEKEYRTFDWYRYNKTQASAGFVTAGVIGGYGVFKILMLLVVGVRDSWSDLWLGLGLVLAGGVLVYLRSGRKIMEKNMDWRKMRLGISREVSKRKKMLRRGINK